MTSRIERREQNKQLLEEFIKKLHGIISVMTFAARISEDLNQLGQKKIIQTDTFELIEHIIDKHIDNNIALAYNYVNDLCSNLPSSELKQLEKLAKQNSGFTFEDAMKLLKSVHKK
ncbi:MAG TPA: hypothetical protein VFJ05_06995 [Nitrososphaeraceae archaeon]|nr:hypothetical protein [Nitrososphaeraceae archaeon]